MSYIHMQSLSVWPSAFVSLLVGIRIRFLGSDITTLSARVAVVTTPVSVTVHAGVTAFQHHRNMDQSSSPPHSQGHPKNLFVGRAGRSHWKSWSGHPKGGGVCKNHISCGYLLSTPLKINLEMPKNKNRFGALCLNNNPMHIFPLQLDSGHKHNKHTPLRLGSGVFRPSVDLIQCVLSLYGLKMLKTCTTM